MSIPQREIVYSKDVAIIMGCSRRTAQRLLEKIRETVGKRVGAYVTISDFCQAVGIKEEVVRKCIDSNS